MLRSRLTAPASCLRCAAGNGQEAKSSPTRERSRLTFDRTCGWQQRTAPSRPVRSPSATRGNPPRRGRQTASTSASLVARPRRRKATLPSRKTQIWLLRADGGEAWRLTDAKESISAYEWAPDTTKVAYLSIDALPKDEDEARRRKDDERIFEGNHRMQHVWTIALDSKQATQITSGTEFTVRSMNWAPDSARIVVGAGTTPLIRDERQDIFVVTLATKTLDKIAATPAPESAPRWSPDGSTIAYNLLPMGDAVTNRDGIMTRPLFNARLMLYDVATKKTTDVSDAKFDQPAGSVVWAPDSKRLYFGIGDRTYRSVVAYNLTTRQSSTLTKEQMISFGNGGRAKTGHGLRTRWIRRARQPTCSSPAADFSAPRKLSNVNPDAADYALGETEIVKWKSSDGWDVEGILVKPVGYEAGKRYPLLVDVAWRSDRRAHQWLQSSVATTADSSGPVRVGRCLYPNPRGSSNYGEKFMRGNIPDWGGGDYRDIMTGVDEVIKRGIADPDGSGSWAGATAAT